MFYFKKKVRAGEMTQRVRALAALPEDQGSRQVPTSQLTTVCYTCYKRSET